MVDQEDYPLPDAFFPPLRSVEYDHDGSAEYEMVYLADSLSAYYHRQESVSYPEGYTAIYNGALLTIRMMPAPSTVMTLNVRCCALPTSMSSDAIDCDLPTVAHDALISFAAYRAWQQWGESTEAQMALMEYQEQRRDLIRGWQSPMRSYPLAGAGVTPAIPWSEMPKRHGG